MGDSLRVGARVRIMMQSFGARPPEAAPIVGNIIRVDARGVLVELDSGKRLLCEPRILAIESSEGPDTVPDSIGPANRGYVSVGPMSGVPNSGPVSGGASSRGPSSGGVASRPAGEDPPHGAPRAPSPSSADDA